MFLDLYIDQNLATYKSLGFKRYVCTFLVFLWDFIIVVLMLLQIPGIMHYSDRSDYIVTVYCPPYPRFNHKNTKVDLTNVSKVKTYNTLTKLMTLSVWPQQTPVQKAGKGFFKNQAFLIEHFWNVFCWTLMQNIFCIITVTVNLICKKPDFRKERSEV